MAATAGRSMAVPLAAFAAGAVVAVLAGIFGRLHDPTLDGTTTLGFRDVLDMKVAVSTAIVSLLLVQLVTALAIFGKLGIDPPPWLGTAHRLSGGLALLLVAFVAYHCLWALGLEVGRYDDGTKVPARTVVHGVLGCAVLGAVVVKLVAVRSRQAPGWFLPAAGGLLLSLLVGAVVTSTLYYVGEEGWPALSLRP